MTPNKSCLLCAFEGATALGTSPETYLFSEIYIPILVRNEDHSPKILEDGSNFEFEYVNVGMTPEQITDAYWTLYGYNKLAVPIYEKRVDPYGYPMTGDLTLKLKMLSIINMNKYKYLKWIDSMGYAYNPLWNVDGSDIFQSLDNHGGVTTNRSPILQTSALNQVTTDSSGTLRNADQTTLGYNNTTTDFTDLTDVTKEKHEHAKNKVNNEDVEYSVAAKDTAFGTALTGGDYMHVEKRLRQGNIGVTMTTQLLEAERNYVRFGLVQEFFKDINKQLLVGTYDGF